MIAPMNAVCFFPGALVRCAPTRLIFSLHCFAPLLRSGIVSKKSLGASSSTKLGPKKALTIKVI